MYQRAAASEAAARAEALACGVAEEQRKANEAICKAHAHAITEARDSESKWVGRATSNHHE